MTGRYKSFSYEITADPEFLNDRSGITPELYAQFETLHRQTLKGGKKIIERLLHLISQYPGVPQLKNYLFVAYMKNGDSGKAKEVNHRILEEHPDYLFGKLNLAFEYYNNKQYDKIPEVTGRLMEIQDLYPDRDCFHLSEVTSFNKLAILYFCAIGNLEAAEARYKILTELAPEHPDTQEVFPYIIEARLKEAQKRMEEENNTRISVKTNTYNKSIQRKTEPEFINKEIEWLYHYGLRIDKEKLQTILKLPYDSLVSDLALVLKDSIYRYEYFKKIEEKHKEWPEELLTFPVHAIYLLGELKAAESLNGILDTFRQGEEFIEFWYGDLMTGNLWEPLYYVAEKQLGVLKEFILAPGIYTYARSEISSCVGQIAFHQPERMDEITGWFRDIFSFLAGASLKDDVIDSDFIGLAIWEALECRSRELLPDIKKLFDLGYVSTGICGDFKDVKRDIYKPIRAHYKNELLNIYDRYDQIITTWDTYREEDNNPEDESHRADEKDEPHRAGPKTGRNDPCPCGSGKKYKKCCMGK